MHNINDMMVEIEGELFPAVNIQIFDFSPIVGYEEGNKFSPYDEKSELGKKDWYGIYFEIMFEGGANLAVYQEMAAALNGNLLTNCVDCETEEFQQHFLVELTHMNDGYQQVHHKWHCTNETELVKVLLVEKRDQARAA